jgi:hypothetical protein
MTVLDSHTTLIDDDHWNQAPLSLLSPYSSMLMAWEEICTLRLIGLLCVNVPEPFMISGLGPPKAMATCINQPCMRLTNTQFEREQFAGSSLLEEE